MIHCRIIECLPTTMCQGLDDLCSFRTAINPSSEEEEMKVCVRGNGWFSTLHPFPSSSIYIRATIPVTLVCSPLS